MPETLVAQFTDHFAKWLSSEGFWISRNRDSAYAELVDCSGCSWVMSVRATTLQTWTLVVVFDPFGSHEEIFYDLDATQEHVVHVLATHLHEVWDESPLV
jgi:hypothetical protein